MIGLYNTAHLLSAKKLEGHLMKSISSGKDTDKLKYASNQSHFHKADWDARKMKAISDGLTSMEVSLGRDRHIAQANYEATKRIRDTFAQMSALGSIGSTQVSAPNENNSLLESQTYNLSGNFGGNFSSIAIPSLGEINIRSDLSSFATAQEIKITSASTQVTFLGPHTSLKPSSWIRFGYTSINKMANISDENTLTNIESSDVRNFATSTGRLRFGGMIVRDSPTTYHSGGSISLSVTISAFGTPSTSPTMIDVEEFSADKKNQNNLRSIHKNMNDFLKSNSGTSQPGKDNLSKMNANHGEIGDILDRVEAEGKFNDLDLIRMNEIVDDNLKSLTELDLKDSTAEFEKSLFTEMFDVKDDMAKSTIDADMEEKSLELANASRAYQINQQMLMNFGASQGQHKNNLISMLVR